MGCVAGLGPGEGASDLYPHIEKLFSTSWCGPHLKNSKDSAGSTGKCVLSHLWKWDLAAPWDAGPWMPVSKTIALLVPGVHPCHVSSLPISS